MPAHISLRDIFDGPHLQQGVAVTVTLNMAIGWPVVAWRGGQIMATKLDASDTGRKWIVTSRRIERVGPSSVISWLLVDPSNGQTDWVRDYCPDSCPGNIFIMDGLL